MKKYLIISLFLITFPFQAFAQNNPSLDYLVKQGVVKVFASKTSAAEIAQFERRAGQECYSCFVTSKDKDAATKIFYEACVAENNIVEGQNYFVENINGTYYVSSELINSSNGTPLSCGQNCIDADGDGWGWDPETIDSCQVELYAPTAGECFDTDGDGWGWNGVSSCLMEGFTPTAGNCVDNDFDGWGWNGVESCVVGATTNPPVANTDETTEVVTVVEPVAVPETAEPVEDTSGTEEAIDEEQTTEIVTTEETAEVEEIVETVPEVPVAENVASAEEIEVVVQSGPAEAPAPAPAAETPEVDSAPAGETEVIVPPLPAEEPSPETTEIIVVENAPAEEVSTIEEEPAAGPTLEENTESITLEPVDQDVCVDEDGVLDGFGWNAALQESCQVPGFVDVAFQARNTPVQACSKKPAGTKLVSSAAVLGSTGNPFYPDAGPQCVYFGNQYNGPGLFYGNFKLSNNAWNAQSSSFGDADDAKAPRWEQCVSLSEKADGTFSPKLTFDWGNEYQINEGYMEWAVKSYPNILFGTHARGDISGDCDTTGLPIAYKDMPKYKIDFEYSAENTTNREGGIGFFGTEGYWPYRGADRNIAIESFFHTTCDIKRNTDVTASNKEYEIMVWLEKGLERVPSGDPSVGVFTDSLGQLFDVFTKPRDDSGYIAYVARETTRKGSLNWNDFIEDAKANSAKYGIKPFQDSWCLGNIIFGSEIWWGEGSVTVDKFDITSEF